jgi:hypothetical protein
MPKGAAIERGIEDCAMSCTRVRLLLLLVIICFVPVRRSQALVWPFGGPKKVQLMTAQMVPGAQAWVDVGRDQNGNTQVVLKVKFLPPPSTLTPPANSYVVWLVPNGRAPENKGELQVGSDHQGELKFPSSYRSFDIYITAEQSAQITEPTGPRIATGQVAD